MKPNVKTVRILIPDEFILKKITSTPTLKQLSRIELKVGENIENVNHYQYSRLLNMLPLIGCKVEEVINNQNLAQ